MLTIITNAQIYIDNANSVTNIMFENGVITGHEVNLADYPTANVVDLHGKYVYGGFNDSHTHVLECGYALSVGIDMQKCTDIESICQALSDKVSQSQSGDVIMGLGFSVQDYTKWSLDDLAQVDMVSPNNPAILFDALGHNAIVNSLAMKLLKIDDNYITPYGGSIVRENGKITGMFREAAMSYPGSQVINAFAYDKIKHGASLALNYWAKNGYTSIVDLMGVPGFQIMKPEIFYDLEKEGRLPIRVNYCCTIFDLNGVTEAAKYVGHESDMVHFYGGKIFIDGAFGAGEAWTTWGHYNDPTNYGMKCVEVDDSQGPEHNLNRIILKAEELGLNMHYHTQGDQAIDAVLDALDQVIVQYGQLKCMHTLAHIGFPTTIQFERMKSFKQHLAVTMQPAFWDLEKGAEYYYGVERMLECYPVKAMMDYGLNVGLSTDFNVSPLQYTSVPVIMDIALQGGSAHTYLPLTVADIIQGFVCGSNQAASRTDVGYLTVGNKADFVVYDKDLFEFKRSYNDLPVLQSTWVNGIKRYSI